ncbi:MAG: hypothetical protein ACYDAG_16625, partial [Chloroflexota bacterium]
MPVETLREIVQRRGFRFRGKVSDLATLARSLAAAILNPGAPANLALHFDRGQLRLLESLSATVDLDVLTVHDVAGVLPASLKDAAREQAAGLVSLGILFPLPDGRYYLPEAIRRCFRGEAPRRLRPHLDLLTVDALRMMSASLGLPLRPGVRKAEIVEFLSDRLSSPPRLAEMYQGLDPAARAMLDMILDSPSPVPVQGLIRRLPAARRGVLTNEWRWTASPYYRRDPNELTVLQERGLVYVIAGYPGGYYGSLLVPEEIRSVLRPS